MSDFAKIGVDFGASSIKMVELTPLGKGRWKLGAAVSGVSPVGGIMANQNNLGAVSQIVIKLIKDAGFKSRKAVISLPENQVSSHIVEMPLMGDEEIKQALQWQVEQYIPIPVEKAVWSYQVIKKGNDSGGVEILLVAAAKTLVSAYNQVLELAGVEVVAIETELMASARSVVPADFPLSIIVDIGAKGTNLGIVKSGVLVYSRTTPTAGEAFTRAIEAGLGLNNMQAEEYKKTYGFSSDKLEGKLLGVMKPVMNVISTEIKKTIEFYVSKHPEESIQVVTLTGGLAVMPDVAQYLSGIIGSEVVIANPFIKILSDPAQVKSLLGGGPFYGVAIGLAMREV